LPIDLYAEKTTTPTADNISAYSVMVWPRLNRERILSEMRT
jgi:hypothetical protein